MAMMHFFLIHSAPWLRRRLLDFAFRNDTQILWIAFRACRWVGDSSLGNDTPGFTMITTYAAVDLGSRFGNRGTTPRTWDPKENANTSPARAATGRTEFCNSSGKAFGSTHNYFLTRRTSVSSEIGFNRCKTIRRNRSTPTNSSIELIYASDSLVNRMQLSTVRSHDHLVRGEICLGQELP